MVAVTVCRRSGRVVSCVDHRVGGRETIAAKPGNTFRVYDDIPFYWDAWDTMP